MQNSHNRGRIQVTNLIDLTPGHKQWSADSNELTENKHKSAVSIKDQNSNLIQIPLTTEHANFSSKLAIVNARSLRKIWILLNT